MSTNTPQLKPQKAEKEWKTRKKKKESKDKEKSKNTVDTNPTISMITSFSQLC